MLLYRDMRSDVALIDYVELEISYLEHIKENVFTQLLWMNRSLTKLTLCLVSTDQ